VTPGTLSTTRLSSRDSSGLSQDEREAVYRRLAAKREAANGPKPEAAEAVAPSPAPLRRPSPLPTPVARAERPGRSIQFSGSTVAIAAAMAIIIAAVLVPRIWPAPPVPEVVQAAARAAIETRIGAGEFGPAVAALSVEIGPGEDRGQGIVYPARAVLRLNEPLHAPAPEEALVAYNWMADRVRLLSQDAFGLPTGVYEAPPVMPLVFEVSHVSGEMLVRTFEFTAFRVSGSWRFEVVEGTLRPDPVSGLRPTQLPAGAVIAGTPEGDRALGTYLSTASRFAERRIAEREGGGAAGTEVPSQESGVAEAAIAKASGAPQGADAPQGNGSVAAGATVRNDGPAVVILESRPSRTIVVSAPVPAEPAADVPANGRLERVSFASQNHFLLAQ
jgi:hypothetical protein